MASITSIYNMALGRLRVQQTVADPEELTNLARTCSRYYDQCRQEVLRAFPWGCALRAEALAAVANQEFPGWTYVYQYPINALMIRAVADEGGIRSVYGAATSYRWDSYRQDMPRYPFQIALKDDDGSQVILSDVPTAWGFHTFDLENVGVYPPDLSSTIAWRLAMEVGGPIQADQSAIDNAERKYYIALMNASAQSLNESRDEAKAESPSISCRY